nr:hypothetical protein [Tanacetum cinerariifolium]
LGRAEFCLVTGFACEKVVFPKYLDGGIPLFFRRPFLDKLKKLEKNKDGELVQDKAVKFKAAKPSVMIKDLGLDIRIFPQQLSLVDSNPTTKLQPTDAEMGQNWYRRSYDYLDVKEKSVPLGDLGGISQDDESDAYTRQDRRGATVGAKVSDEAMNDADMSAVVHVEEIKSAREIVLENTVESLEAKVEKLQLDHDKMAVFFENFKKIQPELEDPSDAAIDGEHMDVVGHPDKNEGPNEKEDPSDAAIDGEHMDTIDIPDETEEPNAQEPISHVLNTPVDNGGVLMTDAPDTINLTDPPSYESEITSPCDSDKKGDELDSAKANQVIITYKVVLYFPKDVPASQNTVKVEVSLAQKSLNPSLDFIIDKYQKNKLVCKPKRVTSTAYIWGSKRHKQGMLSMANTGEVVNEPQLPDSHEDLTRDSKVTKTRIHVSKEVLDFFNQVQKPGYRFPWGTGFAVDDKFWQCLVAKDDNRKCWLNDSMSNYLCQRKPTGLFLIHISPDCLKKISSRTGFSMTTRTPWGGPTTGVVTFYDTLSGLESSQKENLDWWLSLQVSLFGSACLLFTCFWLGLGMEQSGMDLKMHSFRNI